MRIIEIPIRLWLLSDNVKENHLYVYSLTGEESIIRRFYEYNDHGGMDYDDFVRVARKGRLSEITSIEQVPEGDRKIIPFCVDERLPNGRYFDSEQRIEEFFT